jgi:hypothetical protein
MPQFSKRHYVGIAELISQTRQDMARDYRTEPEIAAAATAITTLQAKLTTIFRADNPSFDAERFREACRVKEGRKDNDKC